MKTIVLPTDFSDNARHAHRYAINLFGSDDVKYILLNAYELKYKPSSVMISIEEEMEKESKAELEKEAEELRSVISGAVNFDLRAASGSLPAVINGIDSKEDIDYVVMGTRGASGVASIIGSNTYDVVKAIDTPVLVIPEKAEVKRPKKVLLASDFQEIDNDKVLGPMVDICKITDSEVSILNVVDKDDMVDTEEAAEGVRLHRFLEGLNHSFYFIENDNIEEGISSFAEERNMDIVTMVSRDESIWHRIFHPSETRRMALHSKLPVLVVHE